MKRSARWRLSRRLLWGFALLAAVPILVVGIGIRQYTRALLERSFAERVQLTRQVVTGWREQLERRALDAVQRVAADSVFRRTASQRFSDHDVVSWRLEEIARQSAVDGIDIIIRHDGGPLLAARSGDPTHFGFPSQAPEIAGHITVWSSPERGRDCFGITATLDSTERITVAAYHYLNRQLLAELGGRSTFLLAVRGHDGIPRFSRGMADVELPVLVSDGTELVELDLAGELYAFGYVEPFWFGISMAERQAAVSRLDLVLVMATVLALAVALLAAWRVTYSAARPVEELAETVREWEHGADLQPLVTFAEGETATLADAFEHLRRELLAAERRLSDAARATGWQEMARKVAHEIKNPLTPIRITMEDLARQVEKSPAEATQLIPDAARLVAEEVAALGRIVDSFSRFAKLPEPQPRPTDLGEAVAGTVQLYASDPSTPVDVERPEHPVRVQADPQLLREALANLVKNAVEAAGTAGRVRVAVEALHDSGRVVITDSGPGFSEALLREGLRPYFTTKKGGTGLGLIMAQRIISDMGGKLELANGERGARVTVSIPRAG